VLYPHASVKIDFPAVYENVDMCAHATPREVSKSRPVVQPPRARVSGPQATVSF
jgi:hypothetical protein